MQKHPIHTERTIRAGWPDLLPLTSLAVCLLFGLFALARIRGGLLLCGLGLLGGTVLYLLLYRNRSHVPTNALPFLVASGIGYLCLLTQPERLGTAACLFCGLGLPAVLLPLLTLFAVGPEKLGGKGLLSMVVAGLTTAAVMVYLLLTLGADETSLLTVVGFLALLLSLSVFSVMPSLTAVTTTYLVAQRDASATSKKVVLPPSPHPISHVMPSNLPEDPDPFTPYRPPIVLQPEPLPKEDDTAQSPEEDTDGDSEEVQTGSTAFGALLHQGEELTEPAPPDPVVAAPVTDPVIAEEDALTEWEPAVTEESEEAFDASAGGASEGPVGEEPGEEVANAVEKLLESFAEELNESAASIQATAPLDEPAVPAPYSPFTDSLSEKERRLAGLILQGYAESSIASIMGITVNTQKSYRKNLYTKLDIHSKHELFLLASKHKFETQ